MHCVVLAGGRLPTMTLVHGTLQSDVMQAVEGVPRIHHVMAQLAYHMFSQIIVVLATDNQAVMAHLAQHFSHLKLTCIVEQQAEGSAPALAAALRHCSNDEPVWVVPARIGLVAQPSALLAQHLPHKEGILCISGRSSLCDDTANNYLCYPDLLQAVTWPETGSLRQDAIPMWAQLHRVYTLNTPAMQEEPIYA